MSLAEQLYRRWQEAEERRRSARRACDAAEIADEAAARLENEAAILLRKAIGDQRVLMGGYVVWTEQERGSEEVFVRYIQIVTPEQIEPENEVKK